MGTAQRAVTHFLLKSCNLRYFRKITQIYVSLASLAHETLLFKHSKAQILLSHAFGMLVSIQFADASMVQSKACRYSAIFDHKHGKSMQMHAESIFAACCIFQRIASVACNICSQAIFACFCRLQPSAVNILHVSFVSFVRIVGYRESLQPSAASLRSFFQS